MISGAMPARLRIRPMYDLFTPFAEASASSDFTSPVSSIFCHLCARAKATTSGERGPTSAAVAASGGRPEGLLTEMISFRPARALNSIGRGRWPLLLRKVPLPALQSLRRATQSRYEAQAGRPCPARRARRGPWPGRHRQTGAHAEPWSPKGGQAAAAGAFQDQGCGLAVSWPVPRRYRRGRPRRSRGSRRCRSAGPAPLRRRLNAMKRPPGHLPRPGYGNTGQYYYRSRT